MFQTVALSGSRGERLLFSDVSVTVKPGTLLAVVGENGSGKTSFLRMLCGLLSPDCGAILWQGKDIRQLKELYSAQLTYIGHLNGIKDDLTPVENLKVSVCLAGDDSSGTIVHKALEAVGLGRSVHLLPTRVLSQEKSAAWRWRGSGFPHVRYGSWMSRTLHSLLRPQVT